MASPQNGQVATPKPIWRVHRLARSVRHAVGRSGGKSLAPLYFSAALSLIVLIYCVDFGRSAPFADEWLYFAGPGDFSWNWLMEPLNEHWLPLPKLLYTAGVRASGMDARSSLVLAVVILEATALLTAWELVQRDKWALSWCVPLVVFHPAQYETLLSGENLHFALCAALLIIASVLAVRGQAFGPTWSLIVVALSLSGATGLLYGVPLALAGLVETSGIRRFLVWRLLALVSVAGVSAWYAFGFVHQRGVPTYSVGAAPKVALEALGVLVRVPHTLGPVAGEFVGVLVGVVALFGVGLVCTSRSLSARQKLGLLATVLAVVVAVVGIGYGRGMYGSGAGRSSRYGSIITPLFVVLLLIASTDVRDRLRGWLVWMVAGIVALSWPIGALAAWRAGEAQKTSWQQFESDVRARATFEQIIGRDADAIYTDDVGFAAKYLDLMHAWRLGPFRDYWGEFRHTAGPGAPRTLTTGPITESVSLEPQRFLRAVRICFRVRADPNQQYVVTLSWKSPTATQTRGRRVWIEGDGQLHEQLFWIWDDVDSLSLMVEGVNDNPELNVEELAVFEGDRSELP